MKKRNEAAEKNRISCPEHLYNNEEEQKASPTPAGGLNSFWLAIPAGMFLIFLGFRVYQHSNTSLEEVPQSDLIETPKPSDGGPSSPKQILEKNDFKVTPLPVVKQDAKEREDSLFLAKIETVVHMHLDNSNFSADDFRKELGMSKTQFYRKLHALTGQTPGQFVRVARLERAQELLANQSGNVTEVAYKVGFNNLSYFSKCFRKHFGHLPSEY